MNQDNLNVVVRVVSLAGVPIDNHPHKYLFTLNPVPQVSTVSYKEVLSFTEVYFYVMAGFEKLFFRVQSVNTLKALSDQEVSEIIGLGLVHPLMAVTALMQENIESERDAFFCPQVKPISAVHLTCEHVTEVSLEDSLIIPGNHPSRQSQFN